MKKIISLILCTVMLLSLAPASFAAAANSDHSDIFNNIIKALDKENLDYTADETDEDGDEHIRVTINKDYVGFDVYENLVFNMFVNKEYHRVQIYCYNIIKYDEDISVKDFNKLLATVNDLNRDYSYVKFTVDEDYTSVDAEFDAYVRSVSADEVVIDMLTAMANIVDMSYEDLGVFDA